MATRASLSQLSLPAAPTASTEAATKAYADLMIPLAQRAAASGVATLDGSTKVPVAQLPTGTTSTTVSLGNHSHALSALTGVALSSPSATQVLAYNGTNWVNDAAGMPVVSALANITAPVTGQLALLSTDSMVYRYTGSAWLGVIHTAAGAGFARYTRTTTQSIPDSTVTRLALTTAVNTHADVTANGAFDIFTLNRAGTWRLSANVAYPGSLEGTGRTLWLGPSTDVTASRYALMNVAANPEWITALSVTATVRVTAGQTIAAWTYQDGPTSPTDVTQIAASLSMYWEGP